jgi:hypothetical protein
MRDLHVSHCLHYSLVIRCRSWWLTNGGHLQLSTTTASARGWHCVVAGLMMLQLRIAELRLMRAATYEQTEGVDARSYFGSLCTGSLCTCSLFTCSFGTRSLNARSLCTGSLRTRSLSARSLVRSALVHSALVHSALVHSALIHSALPLVQPL